MGKSWKQGVTTNQTLLLLVRMLARQAARDWLSEKIGRETNCLASDRPSGGDGPGTSTVVQPASRMNEHDA